VVGTPEGWRARVPPPPLPPAGPGPASTGEAGPRGGEGVRRVTGRGRGAQVFVIPHRNSGGLRPLPRWGCLQGGRMVLDGRWVYKKEQPDRSQTEKEPAGAGPRGLPLGSPLQAVEGHLLTGCCRRVGAPPGLGTALRPHPRAARQVRRPTRPTSPPVDPRWVPRRIWRGLGGQPRPGAGTASGGLAIPRHPPGGGHPGGGGGGPEAPLPGSNHHGLSHRGGGGTRRTEGGTAG
jgi:hypothetical protein